MRKYLTKFNTFILLSFFICCMFFLSACQSETYELKEITLQGQKTEFICGEEFSVGDLFVTAKYSNNSQKVVEDYRIDSRDYNKDIAGEYTIYCFYTENGLVVWCKYVVEVIRDYTLLDISVVGQKTNFLVGEEFVFDGEVFISYADCPDDLILTSSYIVDSSLYRKDVVGSYQIFVKVEDKSYTYTVKVEKMKSLKLLMIGNSYSDDTAYYIPEIAKNLGFEQLEFGILYIGGCSIQSHYENSQTGAKGYAFRYYQNGQWTATYGNELKSLEFGIKFKSWDYITLQQSSVYSGVISSYDETLTKLIDYVKKTATNPQVELVWNMTWAYQQNYEHLQGNGYNSQASMYELIANAVEQKISTNANFVKISPAGTAIQNARTSILGDTLNRDGTHLTDVGRYISAMTMFCTITGYSVEDVNYVPLGVDAKTVLIVKESVLNAIENKYEITPFIK